MKKILFVLCAVLLVSCSDYDSASSIIRKHCSNYTVIEKAGETRFVNFNHRICEETYATLALDKKFGDSIDENWKEINEDGNYVYHSVSKWNKGKVELRLSRGKYTDVAVFIVKK